MVWAQAPDRRRMIVAIPLQIKALPAALEERVETDIVWLFRTFDFTSLHQSCALHRGSPANDPARAATAGNLPV